MPRSPCKASTGFRKKALVPVETKVCAIFWAMKPLLPTPVNRMAPVQARQACRQLPRALQVSLTGWPSELEHACSRPIWGGYLAEGVNSLQIQVIEKVVQVPA